MASTTKGTALQSYTDLDFVGFLWPVGRSIQYALETDSLAGVVRLELRNPSD
jgi:hypothetical protein